MDIRCSVFIEFSVLSYFIGRILTPWESALESGFLFYWPDYLFLLGLFRIEMIFLEKLAVHQFSLSLRDFKKPAFKGAFLLLFGVQNPSLGGPC